MGSFAVIEYGANCEVKCEVYQLNQLTIMKVYKMIICDYLIHVYDYKTIRLTVPQYLF